MKGCALTIDQANYFTRNARALILPTGEVRNAKNI